jgi:hypothetical protein
MTEARNSIHLLPIVRTALSILPENQPGTLAWLLKQVQALP